VARQACGGAALLVALILVVLFSALSWSLLATTEIAVRSENAALNLRRAERAAQSGIEWAAADIARTGLGTRNATVPIGPGAFAEVSILSTGSPTVTSRGTADRVSITLVANVTREPGPFPYTVASYSGTSVLRRALDSDGPVYFADPTNPIDLVRSIGPSQGPALKVRGDLDLVSPTPLPAGMVDYKSGGETNLAVAPLPQSVVDTAPFLGLTSGAVAVHHFAGTTTLRNLNFAGIVVVRLGLGDSLEIHNTTIQGTLVVHPTYTPANGTATRISLKGSVTIGGGTAWTGNLAVLAPDGVLDGTFSVDVDLNGVVFCHSVFDAVETQISGMLLTNAISTIGTDFRVVVPSGFAPNLPLGLTLRSRDRWVIEWLGRP
jgi:hypothetical protein